jgi:hypothetical protein
MVHTKPWTDNKNLFLLNLNFAHSSKTIYGVKKKKKRNVLATRAINQLSKFCAAHH